MSLDSVSFISQAEGVSQIAKIRLRWILAVVLSLGVVAATVHLVAGPSPPSAQDARQIVSRYLGVPTNSITIDDSRQKGGFFLISARIARQGDTEQRVVVKLEPTTTMLRYIYWTDPPRTESEGTPVSKAQAENAAEKLFERVFPQVPVEMQRYVTTQVHLNPPIYVFGWRGQLAEDIWSGDIAQVHISSVTGEPTSYMQRIAPKRPDPAEIRVSKERAIEIAKKDLPGHYEHRIAPRCTKARLILSSPLADDEGPVWQLSFDVLFPDSPGTVDHTLVPVHAMSGKVL